VYVKRTWWKEGVVYQVYPRSFLDSNGDGIGDLAGITQKADYLASIGVDIVWLCPIYRSPNKDNGYDISDYEAIMEEFGTMADFDTLLTEFHKRGLKVVMDMVVNHSSDEHPWFKESRASKDSPKRDWYIWKPARNGGPPNNWQSCFGGSAWEFDPATQEYYLHLFVPGQPDLNWENAEMRKAVFGMMRRWLERGVDGFRYDTVTLFSKDPSFRDLLPGETMFSTTAPYVYGPKLHDYMREMRHEALEGFDVMTVGEAPGSTVENAVDLVGEDRGELDMLFQFELMGVDNTDGDKWRQKPIDLVEFKRIIERWQVGLEGRAWNSNFLMNHDQPRALSRFGDDKRYRSESAKALLLLNLALGGTPYIYQGEELGMANVAFPSIDDYRDVETLNYYKRALDEGLSPDEAMKSIHYMSRDNSRTPMQWNSGPHAGFSTAEPWIAVNPDYTSVNAAAEESNPDSVLNFTRSIIRFRKEHLSLVYGSFELLARDDPHLFAFIREGGIGGGDEGGIGGGDKDGIGEGGIGGGERLLVEINMSGEPVRSVAPASGATVLISNLDMAAAQKGGTHAASTPSRTLAPWEARISALI